MSYLYKHLYMITAYFVILKVNFRCFKTKETHLTCLRIVSFVAQINLKKMCFILEKKVIYLSDVYQLLVIK